MKAIIAKEMRELLKWAALVLALLGIGTYAIFKTSAIGMPDIREVLLFWVSHCAAVTTLGAAAGGLLLGIMSTIFEARADRWAFLVHRPLSRTSIFLGKAAAGLALLYLAVGIPFAAAIVWCAASGFWAAPFRLALAVPWTIDLLAGGIYFFAGMTIGLRRARWYGSKVLPLGFPLLATALLWMVPQLWQAVLVLLAALGIAGAAAWGNFLTGGESRSQPLIARATIAVHVFAGACLLAVPAFYVIAALFALALPRERIPAVTYTTPMFLQDGSAMLYTHRADGSVTLTDPQGKVLGSFADYTELRKSFPQEDELSLSYFRWYWPYIPFYFRGYRESGRFYRIVETSGAEIWCFSTREGVLRGYDLVKKRPIGYLGPDGFSPPDASAPAPFPGRPCREEFMFSQPLAFSDGVFRVDFVGRKVLAIFRPEGGEHVQGAVRLYDRRRLNDGSSGLVEKGIAILTTTSIRAVGLSSGKEITAGPLPIDIEKVQLLAVGLASSTGRLIVQATFIGKSGRRSSPEEVFLFDPDGSLARRFELPQYPVPWERKVMRADMTVAVLGGPAWFLGNKAAVAWIGEGMPYFLLGKIWPFLLVPCILCGAVALVLACRESMRRARATAWIATAFLFGLPGLLTLLSLDRRAALVMCLACSKRRPVERDICPHCRTPFPEPDRDGTEIIVGV